MPVRGSRRLGIQHPAQGGQRRSSRRPLRTMQHRLQLRDVSAHLLAGLVMDALWVLGLGAGVFTFVHAARQRPDAFTAVDKLTKGKWLAIIGVATMVMLVFWQRSFFLAIFGVVAVGVYLADVRPKVDEVQRGPRW